MPYLMDRVVEEAQKLLDGVPADVLDVATAFADSVDEWADEHGRLPRAVD
jgi:hypothetical protein